MRQRISRIFKATLGFVSVGVFLGGAVSMDLLLLFTNYIGLVQSFELLGYDQKPLSADRLLGWLFEALLLGDTTASDLYAGVLALGMGVSLIVLSHIVMQIIMQLRDRAVFLRTGDREAARNIELTIRYNTLPLLFLFVPIMVIIMMWDIKMFSYRAFAGVVGYDGSATTHGLVNMENLLLKYGDRFSIGVTRFSPLGYAAIIVFIPLLVEFLFMKFIDRWELFLDAFAGLFSWEERVSLQSQADFPVENGVQNQDSQDSAVAFSDGGVPMEEVSRGWSQPDSANMDTEDTLIDIHEDTDDTVIQQTVFDMDEEVEVIGGGGLRIKRGEALQDEDRFYVDKAGRVWNREYYNNLHGEATQEVAGDKEKEVA